MTRKPVRIVLVLFSVVLSLWAFRFMQKRSHVRLANLGPNSGPAASAELPESACEHGDAHQCHTLAVALEVPGNPPKDPARAFALYTKACHFGDGAGCTRAAEMLADGLGIEKSVTLAIPLFRKGCELHEHVACRQLGLSDDMNGGKALLQACVLNDGEGCFRVGKAHQADHILPRSGAATLAAFSRACELAWADGCYQVGAFRKGCDLGHADACYEAGKLDLARNDLSAAKNILDRACKMGNEEACHYIGLAIAKGPHTETSDLEAATELALECKAGYTDSCCLLSILAVEGKAPGADKPTGDGKPCNCSRLTNGKLECRGRRKSKVIKMIETGTEMGYFVARSAFWHIIAPQFQPFARCIQSLPDKMVRGELRFEISAAGLVKSAVADHLGTPIAEAEPCLDKLTSVRFPPIGGGMRVTLPLRSFLVDDS